MIFRDRQAAGECLARKLITLSGDFRLDADNALVLALPRGGVPVGLEVARTLGLPLDVIVVRKVTTALQPELAVGAVAEGGEMIINHEVAKLLGLDEVDVVKLAAQRRTEIETYVRKYRPSGPVPEVRDRTVILVDDGLATGATALAAIHLLKKMGAHVILAVPVCPADTAKKIRSQVDELVVCHTPAAFHAVGEWYEHFDQVGDDQVRLYLATARKLLQEST